MKICPRYPFPKSLSSGKGLALAFGSNIFLHYLVNQGRSGDRSTNIGNFGLLHNFLPFALYFIILLEFILNVY